MPLEEGAKEGSPGFSRNVATEVKAGKPQRQAVAIAYREARNDMSENKFSALRDLLDEFFSEEENEPEHKDKVDAINDSVEMLSHVVNRTHRTGGERTDALQPNPWASKVAAMMGGIESVGARIAAFSSRRDSTDPFEVTHKGKTYTRTGKVGTNVKTGESSAEYKNVGQGGDARVWRTRSGKIESE